MCAIIALSSPLRPIVSFCETIFNIICCVVYYNAYISISVIPIIYIVKITCINSPFNFKSYW